MKTLAKALALALILPAALRAQAPSLDGTHLYSPATNLEQSELEMLRSAKRSVDVVMYSFTDRELADELVNLARSGVKIRVYRDRTEYQQEVERSDLNTTAILSAAGTEVRVKGQKDLMHLKEYRADGCVRTGSANWSPTGLKRQDNDVRYECSPVAAEQFDTRVRGAVATAVKSHPGPGTVAQHRTKHQPRGDSGHPRQQADFRVDDQPGVTIDTWSQGELNEWYALLSQVNNLRPLIPSIRM